MHKKDKIEVALERSRAMLDSVGLNSWRVETNNSYSVIARTHHNDKKIVYSKRYVTIATREEFDRTTIHEATHALLGRGKGHGDEFVALCNKLNPSAPYDGYCKQATIHMYVISCIKCDRSTTANTKLDGWCTPCAADGGGAYKFQAFKNVLVPTVWASTH